MRLGISPRIGFFHRGDGQFGYAGEALQNGIAGLAVRHKACQLLLQALTASSPHSHSGAAAKSPQRLTYSISNSTSRQIAGKISIPKRR